MAIVLCVPYGRNEATLAALQLQRFLAPLDTVHIFTTTPQVAIGQANEQAVTVLCEAAVQPLLPIRFVVWFGPAQPDWVEHFYALGVHQKWFPDLSSMQRQACLVSRMDDVVCCHKLGYSQAKQWLRSAKRRTRLLYWTSSESPWHWPAGGTRRPLLDLTCGGQRTASPSLLSLLQDWATQHGQTATILYDRLNGHWRQLLRRLPLNSPVKVCRVVTPSERRIHYTQHGVWLGLGLRPHLGVLACEARSLGLFPVVDGALSDLAYAHKATRPCVVTTLASAEQRRQFKMLSAYLTVLDDPAVTAEATAHYTQLLRARQLEFAAYWCSSVDPKL